MCCAAAAAAWSVAPAWGQTTLYTANGFEAGTFNLGNLSGQQSFTFTGSATAATVQGTTPGTTTFSGSRAVQITGSNLVESSAFSGGNFWYQPFDFNSAYNPLASGTRYVQASAMVRTSNAFLNITDIPFAGLHFESWAMYLGLIQQQQSLTPVAVSALGEIQVFAHSSVAGSSNSLFTAQGLMHREQWQKLAVEFDFQLQTFRVYVDDLSTPVHFTRTGTNGTVDIVDVPFRNTYGESLSIAERGVVAYSGRDPSGTWFAPGNNFFVDDYLMTASGTPVFGQPVPEPGLMIATGLGVIAAGGLLRRARARRA
jgi:hypothetical protein